MNFRQYLLLGATLLIVVAATVDAHLLYRIRQLERQTLTQPGALSLEQITHGDKALREFFARHPEIEGK